MIKYIQSLTNIKEDNLKGFFVDWPSPPDPKTHMKLLENSSYYWLAVDSATGNVVGFVTAISDQTLSAYIPLLEVLPEYQGRGIGKELVKKMLTTLREYYMVDLLCDDNLIDFYKGLGMFEGKGMLLRNFEMQRGK